MNSVGLFQNIPRDVFLTIAKDLNLNDLLKVVQVCKNWQHHLICKEGQFIWKQFVSRYSIYEYKGINYYQVVRTCYKNEAILKKYMGAFYAASLWMDSANAMGYVRPLNSPRPTRTCHKFKVTNNYLSLSPYDLRKKEYVNHDLLSIQIYEEFEKGDTKNPTSEKSRYWIQAPIPRHIYNRFTQVSYFSGKFILYVKINKIDAIWERLNAAYQEGKLGYALKACTRRSSHFSNGKWRVVTIHLQNCLDLPEVGRVAWEVNQALEKWKGSLHCKLDVSDFFSETGTKSPLNKAILFSLNSFIFNHKNGKAKALEKFVSLFIQHTEKTANIAKNTLTQYFKAKKMVSIDHEGPVILMGNTPGRFQIWSPRPARARRNFFAQDPLQY